MSGLKAVEETDKAVGNLDYDEQNPQQAHPYAYGFYNGFANSIVNQMKADKTGDEEFAQAMGWGAMATLASDLEPWGMFSKKLPADYQTIADPVARVIDSLG